MNNICIVETLVKCQTMVETEKIRIKQGNSRNRMLTEYLHLAERYCKKYGNGEDFYIRMMKLGLDVISNNYAMGAYREQ